MHVKCTKNVYQKQGAVQLSKRKCTHVKRKLLAHANLWEGSVWNDRILFSVRKKILYFEFFLLAPYSTLDATLDICMYMYIDSV